MGRKVCDILTTSNPWKGQDCERERCMPCDTKERTGRDKAQDCSKRSVVYETWCLNCEEMSKEVIDKMENKTDKEKKELKKNLSLFKYVGEWVGA